mgnify:CR=1 FL=1
MNSENNFFTALMRGEAMEDNRGSTRNLTRRKEDSSQKIQSAKAKRPLLWMRIDEMIKVFSLLKFF